MVVTEMVGGMHRHCATQWHFHRHSHLHSHCPGWDCGDARRPAAAPSPDSHSNLPKDRGTGARATGGGAAAAAGSTHAAAAARSPDLAIARPKHSRFASALGSSRGTDTMLDIFVLFTQAVRRLFRAKYDIQNAQTWESRSRKIKSK